MRPVLIIILILGLGSCINRIKELPEFKVIHMEGCEAIETYEIIIFKQNNQYFASKIKPFYYYGGRTDSIWTVKLSDKQIDFCIDFLNMAKSLPNKCNNISTSIDKNIIEFSDKQIVIEGNCDWKDFGFFKLQKELFKDKLLDLTNKRLFYKDSINKILNGTWYYLPFDNIKRNDSLYIFKTTTINKQRYNWTFSDDYFFRSTDNIMRGLSYSNKYRLDVDSKFIFLIIDGGFYNKKADVTTENLGGSFVIDSISRDKIKLVFLWR